jgi:hypothetical protein
MACEEKQRLGAAYETATKHLSNAISELQQHMGVCSKAEYDRLTIAAKDARATSEQELLALEHHIRTHHC